MRGRDGSAQLRAGGGVAAAAVIVGASVGQMPADAATCASGYCSSTPLAKVYWGDDWIPLLCTGVMSLAGESQSTVTLIAAGQLTGYYYTYAAPSTPVPFCGSARPN